MKILIIGPANPYRGGIAALNERLAQQLINEGHQVEIISFKVQYPNFLFPGKSQFTNTPAPKDLIISRMINSVNPLNWVLTGFKLRKKRADLVLVRFWLPFMAPSTGTVCKWLKKGSNTKIIAIVDNLIPHEPRIGDKLFTKYFIRQTDAFLAMSECVYNDIKTFSQTQPVTLSPHPIYDHYGERIPAVEARAKLGLEQNMNYILFFGFIRDYKGLDLLLHAMANDRIKKLNIRLIVAGEFYSNEEKFQQLIDSLNLRDNVILHTDYIPENRVNEYFCASNLVAQPYKTATQSGVTQIGYHFHKPMLVTNVGGLSEIIENGKAGFVVEPTPDEIAMAIDRYFENNLEEEMTEEVKRAKERFSWNNFTKAIFESYLLCTKPKKS
jgi:D-inositol-3-phosphate glycosyltransferase